MKLEVELFGKKFKNPVWVASGTFGFGIEYEKFTDLNEIGAICVKGLSIEPEEGNPPPRICETPCGMLNSIGLQNPGVRKFISSIYPILKDYETQIIVNIYGKTERDYVKVAQALNDVEIAAIELNISCPNVEKGGMAFGSDPNVAARLTEEVKRESRHPVIVKLSPNAPNILAVAKAVESAGADAVSAINTLLGMAVDIRRRRSKLNRLYGGLSGPAIKPIALRIVHQLANNLSIPVIGIGGISSAEDAAEFFIVGAKAVQIGTANFVNPNCAAEVVEGLRQILKAQNLNDINELIGSLIT